MNVRGPLHWWTAGSGPLVVALHPNGMDSRVWSPLVRVLGDVTVVAVDRPGHGGSIDRIALQRAAESVRSADEYAAHVGTLRSVDDEPARVEETLAAALGAEPDGATLVGYGDGGLLALEVTARGRIRVDAVVAVDSPVLPPTPALDLDAVLSMLEEHGVDLDARRVVLDQALRNRDPDSYADAVLEQFDLAVLGDEAATLRDMVRDNAFSALLTAPSRLPDGVDLTGVTVPVRLVHASSPPPGADDLARAMPRATITTVTVPQRPTSLALAHPEEIAQALRGLLPEG